MFVEFFKDAEKITVGNNMEINFRKLNDDYSILMYGSVKINRNYSCVNLKDLQENLKKEKFQIKITKKYVKFQKEQQQKNCES